MSGAGQYIAFVIVFDLILLICQGIRTLMITVYIVLICYPGKEFIYYHYCCFCLCVCGHKEEDE